ncbi:NYN domain-containing protein [Agrobacterium vitis]|uniref:NYN domain-containing protein n=1 Tax=Agrobacterium vitis TaxID=373 RepID=A0ABD6G8Z6_AGRVI|nr:NYN domain-containing protein [Agrobacterium vitis]MUO79340.1 NYN domain-containing protein [Agrobacterium vitis]MUO96165.1 NYN domain-containing protein [Agrobacterium vitis]MUP05770.1 NYN domain-containing protein [Agrobacterium vitis]MUZ82854.1 NYN domain-containing protein [Agrobacterium vitis]MVA11770.1 NYN domain-containing protein [Agrobacterium vitis]
MADWIYVDNSNVFIEGKRVSAVKLGLALDIWDAFDNRILDNNYRMSFGRLYEFVAGANKSETARAMLFGSRPPENDAIWGVAKRAGFEVITHDRNIANKEKKIDTGLVAALTRDAYRNAKTGDIFTIVSGDNDYVPAVQQLREDGFQVDVVFWSHAGKELQQAASNFISLDDHLDNLRA